MMGKGHRIGLVVIGHLITVLILMEEITIDTEAFVLQRNKSYRIISMALFPQMRAGGTNHEAVRTSARCKRKSNNLLGSYCAIISLGSSFIGGAWARRAASETERRRGHQTSELRANIIESGIWCVSAATASNFRCTPLARHSGRRPNHPRNHGSSRGCRFASFHRKGPSIPDIYCIR